MSKLRAVVVFQPALRPRLAVEHLHEAAGVETSIDWPNNLLSGEQKNCGVLAEAIETAIAAYNHH